MGLDTTHNCWHGSYSSFSEWRRVVAQVAGYKTRPVEYKEINYKTTIIDIDYENFSKNAVKGDWGDIIPEDPLMYLIAHSDCEGKIMNKHCLSLAMRLEELIPLIPDHDIPCLSHRQSAKKFADGLRLAYKNKENVEFC